MRKTFLYILTFLILTQSVLAVTVHGTVYSVYLDILNDARVEVNSQPQQIMIAKDGEYSFELPPGTYAISARYAGTDGNYSITETVTITKDSEDAVIDLLLLPDFDTSDTDDLNDIDTILGDVFQEKQQHASSTFIYIGLAALLCIILYLFWIKRRFIPEHDNEDNIQTETEENLQQLIAFITEHDGRVTQRDIRKHFPWSESKISLMIAELEHKGTLKKIKRGRGNIIILH